MAPYQNICIFFLIKTWNNLIRFQILPLFSNCLWDFLLARTISWLALKMLVSLLKTSSVRSYFMDYLEDKSIFFSTSSFYLQRELIHTLFTSKSVQSSNLLLQVCKTHRKEGLDNFLHSNEILPIIWCRNCKSLKTMLLNRFCYMNQFLFPEQTLK